MNRAETVRQALIWEAAAKKAYARAAAWKQQLATQAQTELAEQGTAPTWRLPELATVWLPVSHEAAYVADPAAFTKWVQANHPTEIETVVQVRPAFQAAFVDAARVDGDQVLDAEGTVIPGLAVRPGNIPQTLRVQPSREAKQVLGDAADQVLAMVAASLHLPAPPEPEEVPGAEA